VTQRNRGTARRISIAKFATLGHAAKLANLPNHRPAITTQISVVPQPEAAKHGREQPPPVTHGEPRPFVSYDRCAVLSGTSTC
jgi:hypothetical protein